MSRAIRHRYSDPLDLIWLRAADELGIRVLRSSDAYASFDGKGTLTLARPEDFDPDDSLAQLIFHELCHALVASPDGRALPDWGLDNQSDRDREREHACHRVQAALAAPYGLRDFFAVTTDHREHWDALPDDPLKGSADPAVLLARRALIEAEKPPWKEALSRALEATARLAEVAREAAPEGSLWRTTRARHGSGFLAHDDPEKTCGACAWSYRKAGKLGCRQADRAGRRDVRVRALSAACDRFEPRLSEESCGACGACCREGFDRVEVRARDVVKKRHPQLVVTDSWGVFLPRPDGRCVALEGGGDTAFRCRIYGDRPRACAELEVGGAACLDARRRVGISR